MADALPFDPTAPKVLPKPGPRRPLSKHEYAEMFLAQMGKCFNCGVRLAKGNVIDEHIVPRETLPADRCDDLENRKLFCRPCAKAKTVKDQALIGHMRRVRGESGQKKRLREKGPVLKSRNNFSQPKLLPLRESKDPSRILSGFKRPEGYVSPLSKKSKSYRNRGFGK